VKRKLIGLCAVVLVLALLLTLAPACGKGEVGPGVTPTPGTPGVTPTPTPQAKELKIGCVTPLSGPAAPWGVEGLEGGQWAVDKINTAGGFKVGADTYMVKIVSADTKGVGSVANEQLTRLIYDEGIHYAYGTTSIDPLQVLAEQGKCFFGIIGNAISARIPYCIVGAAPPAIWHETFWKQAYQFHPEIKTVAVVADVTANSDLYVAGCLDFHPRFGREVVEVKRYQPGTTDYYPVLTSVVAKNPDAIDFAGGIRGDIDLMVKQARELGYRGICAGGAHGDAASTIAVAGCAYAEGFIYNDPDYNSELYPESTRQLYAEFQKRFPGRPLALTTYLGYGFVQFYRQAIEKAGSIDPDTVMKVLDDPNWTFEWFGQPGKSLGGANFEKNPQLRRWLQDEVTYSELVNCKKVMKSREAVVIP